MSVYIYIEVSRICVLGPEDPLPQGPCSEKQTVWSFHLWVSDLIRMLHRISLQASACPIITISTLLLWMGKILHRFSEFFFFVPRAPFLTLAVKSYWPDLFQWPKSCTAQVVLAANVKQGVRGLMPQSFEVRMYKWCKISSIHRRAEVLLHLLRTYSNWLTAPAHPGLGRLDSGHTTQQFIPSRMDAKVNAAKHFAVLDI